jgi:hypothetical protein
LDILRLDWDQIQAEALFSGDLAGLIGDEPQRIRNPPRRSRPAALRIVEHPHEAFDLCGQTIKGVLLCQEGIELFTAALEFLLSARPP